MFRSRAVFAIGAIGGNPVSEPTDKENESADDAHALTAIPHGRGSIGSGNDQHTLSDKQPLQKRILRKVWLLLKATSIQTCHILVNV